jgi:hypothetical protein
MNFLHSECCSSFFYFFHSQQHSKCCSSAPHAHTTLTQHKKHNTTMATHRPITPSSIFPPHTWAIALKPFLFPSQHPYVPSDASAASVPLPIARPQPTTDTDTQIHESSTPNLVQFTVKPFHLRFEQNHFPSISNN